MRTLRSLRSRPHRTSTGSLVLVAKRSPLISEEEFLAHLAAAPPPTPDDVSILFDGRRLDSKEAVLEWLAEVEADRKAGRFVDLDDD